MPSVQGGARARTRTGHVRQVVTDHRRSRRGIGRSLTEHVFETAATAGRLAAQAPCNAVAFHCALGFEEPGPVEVPRRLGGAGSQTGRDTSPGLTFRPRGGAIKDGA